MFLVHVVVLDDHCFNQGSMLLAAWGCTPASILILHACVVFLSRLHTIPIFVMQLDCQGTVTMFLICGSTK